MKKIFCVMLFGCAALLSALEFPGAYSDRMVLLRDTENPFFGKSFPGAAVTLDLDGKNYTAKAGKDGSFKIMIPAHKAGGPFEITVSDGREKKVFRDVLFGEVWIVSGQSNMSFPLWSSSNPWDRASNGKEAMEHASEYPLLRLCKANFRTCSFFPPEDRHDLVWKKSDPKSASSFSAIGFLFGRMLQKKLGVPVGIIASAFPATRMEAWLPEETIRSLKLEEDIAKLSARDRAGAKKEYDSWMLERRKRQIYYNALHAGKKDVKPDFNKKLYVHYGQNFPSTQYKGMIYPFLKYPVRGMLWYQGESNAGHPENYALLLETMIREYRARWCTPGFVFIAAQLSAFHAHRRAKPLPDDFWKKIPVSDSPWARIREAQEGILSSLPKTGLAVTLDHGDHSNIHPLNKQIVAERFFAEAMRLAYGEKLPEHPRFEKAVREGKSLRLFFRHTHGGLLPGKGRIGNFTLAGKDKVFHKAEAFADGETLLVSSPEVLDPVYVRYAWENYPGDVKLYAKSGRPFGSFRSDKFDYKKKK